MTGLSPTRIEPLFACLGYHLTPSGLYRYHIKVGDDVRVMRTHEICSLAFLFDVYPYPEHWRRLFPYGRNKIDTKAAGTWFIRECKAKGKLDNLSKKSNES